MINIAICEETQESGRRTESLIKEYAKLKRDLDIDITTYGAPLELLSDIEKGRVFQIYLLGVDLPGISGFELAGNMRKQGIRTALIFISSVKEYAVEAFDVDAIHFLMKGYSPDQLKRAIEKANNYAGRERREQVVFSVKDGYKYVYMRDIMYTVGQRKMQRIVMKDGEEFEVRITGQALADKLMNNCSFIRCGSSYIVNMFYISSMHAGMIEMKDGNTITIPRRIQKQVKEEFNKLKEKFGI